METPNVSPQYLYPIHWLGGSQPTLPKATTTLDFLQRTSSDFKSLNMVSTSNVSPMANRVKVVGSQVPDFAD